MSCLGVMLYGEGEEGRSRWCAELEDCFVAVRIESSASTWHDGWVFDPDFETAVCADGGYEVGVDG